MASTARTTHSLPWHPAWRPDAFEADAQTQTLPEPSLAQSAAKASQSAAKSEAKSAAKSAARSSAARAANSQASEARSATQTAVMSDLLSKRPLGAAMAELARIVPKAPSAATANGSTVSRIGAVYFPEYGCTVPRTLAKNRQHNLRNSDGVHRVFDPAGKFDPPKGAPDIISDAESLALRVPKRREPHVEDLKRQVRR